ncbi:MAG: hypothetical protein H8K03_10735 [Nitrospira sp.]
MRNKIPCSAERLGLLDPQMIKAVTEASAYQIGQQYLTENRVRIVEADDSQITSAVIGNSGLYEQTIRLKDGHLISKCSCTASEEPMCRHCIAVLLEYHRWAQPRQVLKPGSPKESKPLPQVDSPTNGKAPTMQAPAVDVKLNEIMQLMEWLQSATKAIGKQEVLPEPPKLGPGEISTWIRAIMNLEERCRESEDAFGQLEADLHGHHAHVGRLTQQLQTATAQIDTTRMTVQELQRQIATYKETLIRVGELTAEVVRYDEQMQAAARDMLQKGSQFDTLAGSFKEVAEALRAAVKIPPL